jgi:hypothetical protein
MAFDFKQMKEDLEEYRVNGMSTFQKVNLFFMDLTNDFLVYYINAKKTYDELDVYPKTATRDFLLRQLKIQIEDYILPAFTISVK